MTVNNLPRATREIITMKVAILAGGQGTRLAEETDVRPKPMVEIGGRPILWHLMRHYSHHGYNEFVIALGYKGDYIKKYFADYQPLGGNLTIRIDSETRVECHEAQHAPWQIDLVETGAATLTGGRVKRLKPFLGDSTFMLTWGDGISDVDINKLYKFHRAHGRLATVTAVRPPARYGHIQFAGQQITSFEEKPQTAEGWINGAFFVLEPEVLEYIDDDMTMFEHEPMRRLAHDGELMGYQHDGFWACMDTLRDKRRLQDMWEAGNRPWATWESERKATSANQDNKEPLLVG